MTSHTATISGIFYLILYSIFQCYVFLHFIMTCCASSVPVVYRQLLPGNNTQFDVLQAGRKRGLVEGYCDFLLVAVNIFHCSYRTRKQRTLKI